MTDAKPLSREDRKEIEQELAGIGGGRNISTLLGKAMLSEAYWRSAVKSAGVVSGDMDWCFFCGQKATFAAEIVHMDGCVYLQAQVFYE